MRKDKFLKLTITLIVISIIYTILVKTVDVASIGPENSAVGFAGINGYLRDLLGYNNTWYKISKYLGILTFAIVANYGVVGLKQWYERKN